MNSKRKIPLVAALVVGIAGTFATPCQAFVGTLNASGTFDFSNGPGGTFDYTITLVNSSSSTLDINSFWYGWTFSGNFLPFQPSAPAGPTGWTASLSPSSGLPSSIQFQNSTGSGIAPGSSATFTFIAPPGDGPAVLGGNTSGPPSGPVGNSFAFSGSQVLSGLSSAFVVTQVPEPSTLALLAVGGISAALLRSRRKNS